MSPRLRVNDQVESNISIVRAALQVIKALLAVSALKQRLNR